MASGRWLGAQGEQNGQPVLVRTRVVPADSPLRTKFLHLFEVRWRLEGTEPMGLPSPEQYLLIAAYEKAIFDTLERDGRGVLVWTRTHAWTVQHFGYVDDVELAARVVAECEVAPETLELSSVDNDAWAYLDGLQQRLDGFPPG